MNKRKREKKTKRLKDTLWADDVKKRYNHKCAICGNPNMLNAHHIIPRQFIQTRWMVENGIALCPKHHKFGNYSAHKNALWFIRFLLREDFDRISNLGTIMDDLYSDEEVINGILQKM